MPEPDFVKIKLPNSDGLTVAMGGAFGVVSLAAALLTPIAQPSELLDKIGIAIGLVLGMGCARVAARVGC